MKKVIAPAVVAAALSSGLAQAQEQSPQTEAYLQQSLAHLQWQTDETAVNVFTVLQCLYEQGETPLHYDNLTATANDQGYIISEEIVDKNSTKTYSVSERGIANGRAESTTITSRTETEFGISSGQFTNPDPQAAQVELQRLAAKFADRCGVASF